MEHLKDPGLDIGMEEQTIQIWSPILNGAYYSLVKKRNVVILATSQSGSGIKQNNVCYKSQHNFWYIAFLSNNFKYLRK